MGVNVMGTGLSNMLNNELMVSVMYPNSLHRPPAGDLWGYFVIITRAGLIQCPHLIVGIVGARNNTLNELGA